MNQVDRKIQVIDSPRPTSFPTPSVHSTPSDHTHANRSIESVSRTDPERMGGEYLKGVIENYLKYYAEGESHTARAKRYDLQYFLEFLAQRYGQDDGSDCRDRTEVRKRIDRVTVSDWTLQATKDFIEYRLGLGEAPATVGRRLATIKHFGRTLAERVSGYINPAREAKAPVAQALRPHGLSANEIELLQQAARQGIEGEREGFLAQRNGFLLELLLATGLRADEVRLLLCGQISEDRTWLRNVKTKGKKFRSVYLESSFRPQLENYLSTRELELQKRFPLYAELTPAERNRFPVLVSFYRAELDQPSSFGLSPKSIWRIISGLGRNAQALAVSKMPSLHPHKLRHTFAHGLLDSSKDLRLVAQALGHSDVRTTMRYTERTDEQIAEAIERKRDAS